MKKKSNEALSFVAVAHFREYPNSQEDVGNIRLETVAIKPETTALEIFNSFWPDSEDAIQAVLFKPPFKIEILPDTNTIPKDDDLSFPTSD